MGPCRYGRGKFGSIVVNPGPRWQEAIHDCGAGGGAKWARGIGIFKNNPGFCKSVQIGSFRGLVAVGAQELGRQLICNDEKNIGFCHDEIFASVLDPRLPAHLIVNNGQALPLFTDMF
jgi:hypothetical protein